MGVYDSIRRRAAYAGHMLVSLIGRCMMGFQVHRPEASYVVVRAHTLTHLDPTAGVHTHLRSTRSPSRPTRSR